MADKKTPQSTKAAPYKAGGPYPATKQTPYPVGEKKSTPYQEGDPKVTRYPRGAPSGD